MPKMWLQIQLHKQSFQILIISAAKAKPYYIFHAKHYVIILQSTKSFCQKFAYSSKIINTQNFRSLYYI
jgi:hypothetical protein